MGVTSWKFESSRPHQLHLTAILRGGTNFSPWRSFNPIGRCVPCRRRILARQLLSERYIIIDTVWYFYCSIVGALTYVRRKLGEAKMIDPLLRQIVKTATLLKAESERADSPELLSRVERLASLLYVQAAEARAEMTRPPRWNG